MRKQTSQQHKGFVGVTQWHTLTKLVSSSSLVDFFVRGTAGKAAAQNWQQCRVKAWKDKLPSVRIWMYSYQLGQPSSCFTTPWQHAPGITLLSENGHWEENSVATFSTQESQLSAQELQTTGRTRELPGAPRVKAGTGSSASPSHLLAQHDDSNASSSSSLFTESF